MNDQKDQEFTPDQQRFLEAVKNKEYGAKYDFPTDKTTLPKKKGSGRTGLVVAIVVCVSIALLLLQYCGGGH